KQARQRFDMGTMVPLMAEEIKRVLAAKPDKAVAPLAKWLVRLFSLSGPRVLLGRKWSLMKPLMP
ncbi:MAG: hypothetical protein WCV00_24400, partial [Verrucomicrobiia bacterium]